jgi:hypothetical protein
MPIILIIDDQFTSRKILEHRRQRTFETKNLSKKRQCTFTRRGILARGNSKLTAQAVIWPAINTVCLAAEPAVNLVQD